MLLLCFGGSSGCLHKSTRQKWNLPVCLARSLYPKNRYYTCYYLLKIIFWSLDLKNDVFFIFLQFDLGISFLSWTCWIFHWITKIIPGTIYGLSSQNHIKKRYYTWCLLTFVQLYIWLFDLKGHLESQI